MRHERVVLDAFLGLVLHDRLLLRKVFDVVARDSCVLIVDSLIRGGQGLEACFGVVVRVVDDLLLLGYKSSSDARCQLFFF